MRKLLLVLPVLLAVVACTKVRNVVVKDVAIEDQKAIMAQYDDKSAWTRGVLEDMGEGGSIPRDTKVTIVDIGMHYTGSVTVQTLKKRNRIVHALEIERPLTPSKLHERLGDLFWFKDPTLRQVDYIRKWGKKAARAIVDHEVFIGMTAEAATESWGVPSKKNIHEIEGKVSEQWVYPAGKRSRYIYVLDGKVSKWDD